MTNMNNKSKIGLAVGVALAAVVAGGVWMALNPTPEPIYGMVQAKTVDVASKSRAVWSPLTCEKATWLKSAKPLPF